MERYMISRRINLIVYWVFFIHLFFIEGKLEAQGTEEIDRLVAKYPNNPVVFRSRQENVNIEVSGEKFSIVFDEYKEYVALTNSANYYADSKEYFSGLFKKVDIEAYSLVPEKSGYKKIPVTEFKKTSERGDYSFYDDQSAYKFVFPSVIKGTRMITKLHTLAVDPVVPYKFYFGNYFPCEEYQLTITCPENVNIIFKLYGKDTSAIKFSFSRKAGKKIYAWRCVDGKSYIRDVLAPDMDYFVPHLLVQIASYEYKGKTTHVIGSLMGLYKWNYSKIAIINTTESGLIKSLGDSLTKNISPDREKVNIIFDWVQKHIKYVAIEDGENGYIPRDAELVLKRRYGDCKDKTSLLVALLRSQQIPSSYGWIGTRDIPYRYSDFPTGFNDNHMVAVWWENDQKPVILDGTTRFHETGLVPAFIQGQECMIERGPDNYVLHTVPVAAPEENIIYDSLSIRLQGDTVVGNGIIKLTGERKTDMLYYFEGKDSADLPKILSGQFPKASNKFIIKSVVPSKPTNAEDPFSFAYHFSLPDYITHNKNTAYLNLNLDRFLSEINLREDRTMPVEAEYSQHHVFVCNFQLPAGYIVRDIPGSSSYDSPLFGFRQEYTFDETHIILRTVVYINFLIIEGKDLATFRDMLRQLNAAYLKSIQLINTTEQ